jgi:hypothetical protein
MRCRGRLCFKEQALPCGTLVILRGPRQWVRDEHVSIARGDARKHPARGALGFSFSPRWAVRSLGRFCQLESEKLSSHRISRSACPA